MNMHVNNFRQTFTNDQDRAVWDARRYFNANERAIAERLGGMAGGIVGNAQTLSRDAWQVWDREGSEVLRDELVIYAALAPINMPMPIGKSVHNFKMLSDSGALAVSMDGRQTANLDRPLIKYGSTAIPIFNSTWGFGWREVEAANTDGSRLDSTANSNANRVCAVAIENAMLTGWSNLNVQGQQSYGLTNHPSRNTRSHTFTLGSATGAQWVTAFVEHIKLLQGDNVYTNNVITFVNYSDWFYASTTEFAAGYPKTIAQKIQEIAGVGMIVPSPRITANHIITIVKDRSTYQILTAMPVNTTPLFRANPSDDYNFMTWGALSLELKTDYDGRMGLAHSTT